MNILIVDDRPANLRLLRFILESEGHTVCEAVDGIDALDILNRDEVDVIISDILMPRMDGYRLCQEVRKSERLGHIPFIFYTATYTSPSDEKLCLDIGGDKYLQKPATPEVLAAALAEVTQNGEKRKRRVSHRTDENETMKEYSASLVFKLEEKIAELLLQTTAMETAANAIVITDAKGKILKVNPAFTTLSGYPMEEAVGQNPRMLKSGRHEPAFYHDLWQTILSGQTWRGEFINRRKDGSLYYGEQTITPVRAQGGPITHFIGIMNDVTARRHAEAESERQHAELQLILDAVPALVFYKDRESRFLRVNRELARLVGAPPEAFIGKTDTEMGSPDGARYREDDLRVLASGEPIIHQEERLHTQGGIRWLLTDKIPHRDETGRIIGVIGFAVDITERRNAEEALKLFRNLVDQSTDTFEVIDPETGRFLDVNERGPVELSCTREEYLSLRVPDVDPTVTEASWAELAAKIQAAGSLSGEGRHRRKDGTSFPIEFNARWVHLDRDYIVTVVRDISERKRAEEALRESELRLRQVVETIHEVFWMLDLETEQVVYVSPKYESISGRPCERLYASPGEWMDAVHPEDRDRVQKAYAANAAAGTYDEEYRIVRPDGQERWIRDRGFPVKDDDGKVYRIAGVAEDITERKKLEQQFLRAQRMESIGTLAGGIAHDLNNVLGPIIMSLDLFKMKFTDPDSQELLEVVRTSAQRGADMVRQVLSFARGVEGRQMEVQIRHLIGDIEKILIDTLLKNITTRTVVPHDLWSVTGDPTQLHQVLLNLCVNARDAMPDGGKLTISAENRILDEQYAGLNLEAKPGPYVYIQVEDSGTGIAPEILEKIFDPFFTTKEVGKGTGLGLSTAMGIIKSHGGFIRVYSELGKGTKFSIYLPALTEAFGAAAPEAPDMPRGHDELILVVDDEPAARQITQQTLEAFGYRVILATDGAEAVATYAARGEEIAVVLTDMTMPIMDGLSVILVLLKINPSVRIIGASGLSDHGYATKAASLGVKHFLPKPFTAEDLLKTLRVILADD